LSPKPSIKTSIFWKTIKKSNALDLVLVYLKAHYGEWAKDKNEVTKALSSFEDSPYGERLNRLWGEIEPNTNGEEIKEVSRQSSDQWDFGRKLVLLDGITSLEIGNSAPSQPFLGEFIKHLIASKFKGTVDSIFDPAFGFGNLIFGSLDGSIPGQGLDVDEDGNVVDIDFIIAKRIEGAEINSSVCSLANVLGRIFGFNIDIKVHDSLRPGGDLPSKHQLVVCEPPLGMKISPDYLKQDWEFGQPPSQNADWAWAQIVCKHLSADGYGLLFVPRGALFRSGKELTIRSRMISAGTIRAVINLPSGSSSSSRVPMSLIIFAGAGVPLSKSNEILFLSIPEPDGRPGSMEHPIGLFNSIHQACDVFENFEQGKFKRVIGYSAVVSRTDKSLNHNDFIIDPSNYVTQVATGIDVKLSVRSEMQKISKESEELFNLISETKEKLNSFIVKAEFTTIGEMIKSGKLIQVTGMTKNEFKREVYSDSLQEEYLEVSDVRRVGPLNATGVITLEAGSSGRPKIRTEPNDVVFIKTGKPAAKVDYYGGALLFSPLSVLRLTDEGKKHFNHKVLAFYLNGEGAKKFMHGGTVGRLEIEKVPFPLFDAVNRKQINESISAIEKLIMRSNSLNNQLNALDSKLSKVLWGEFDGLEEAE